MIRVAETEISADLHGDLQLLLQECFAGYPGRSYFKLPPHFRYLAMTGSGGVAAQVGVEYRIIRVGDAVLRTFGIVDLCGYLVRMLDSVITGMAGRGRPCFATHAQIADLAGASPIDSP